MENITTYEIWLDLEYGPSLFWDGEKWSDDAGLQSWTDLDEVMREFDRCVGSDTFNMQRVYVVKSVCSDNEPDVKTEVIKERVFNE